MSGKLTPKLYDNRGTDHTITVHRGTSQSDYIIVAIQGEAVVEGKRQPVKIDISSVSYTHLTLPTILLV